MLVIVPRLIACEPLTWDEISHHGQVRFITTQVYIKQLNAGDESHADESVAYGESLCFTHHEGVNHDHD